MKAIFFIGLVGVQKNVLYIARNETCFSKTGFPGKLREILRNVFSNAVSCQGTYSFLPISHGPGMNRRGCQPLRFRLLR